MSLISWFTLKSVFISLHMAYKIKAQDVWPRLPFQILLTQNHNVSLTGLFTSSPTSFGFPVFFAESLGGYGKSWLGMVTWKPYFHVLFWVTFVLWVIIIQHHFILLLKLLQLWPLKAQVSFCHIFISCMCVHTRACLCMFSLSDTKRCSISHCIVPAPVYN